MGPLAERVGRQAVAARYVLVRGLVQGVGYRPFVWHLARRRNVCGSVRNAGGVVEILAEGNACDLDAFCRALVDEAPPSARVHAIARGWVPPDVATCEECLTSNARACRVFGCGRLAPTSRRRSRAPGSGVCPDELSASHTASVASCLVNLRVDMCS